MAELNSYQQAKQRLDEDVRLRVANELDYDPGLAQRILNVTGSTGLPEEVVDSDLDNLESMLRKRQFDIEKYRDNAPKFAAFVAENPYHLSALKDDMEHLSSLERNFRAIGLGFDSSWATVELGRIRSRQMGGDTRPEDEERLKELRKLLQPHEFGAEGSMAKFLVKNAKMVGPTLYGVRRGLEHGLGGASVGAAAGTIAGPGAPITVPAAATLGFGVGFTEGLSTSTFELERGFAYDEYLEMGMSEESAKIAANSVGLVNMALESFGIGKTIKYIPGVDKVIGNVGKALVKDVLVKPSMQKATGMAVARFGEVLGTEIVTEVLQESTTIAGGEILKSVEGKGAAITGEEFADRVANIAMETLQGAAIMSSLGPTMSFVSDSVKARRASQMETVYKALGEAAEGSTTRTKLPAKWREYVAWQTKDGPVKSMFIDVDRFTEYFQEVGQDPDQVAAELGIDLETARTESVDLEIPLATWVEKIAPTEHHKALIADVKSDPNEMTAREGALYEANKDERQRELDSILAESATQERDETVYQSILGQLLATGHEKGAAEQLAGFTERVFSTLSSRNDRRSQELFERYFGGVAGEVPAALQKPEDIDIHLDPMLDRLRAGDIPTDRDIYGESLAEFVKKNGGLIDDGGELSNRDWKGRQSVFRKNGRSLDGMAEIAREAGFTGVTDPDTLLDALDEEISHDNPVFSGTGDSQLYDVANSLQDLEKFLRESSLNVDKMSNAEIRAALDDRTTYNQFNQLEFDELLETFYASAAHDPNIMAKLMAMAPDIFEGQDFGDLSFTDKVRLEGTDEVVEVTQSAQNSFNKAVKRRNIARKLLDCISG